LVPAYREELANSYINLARVLSIRGHVADAEKALQEAQPLLEKLAGEFQTISDYQDLLASVLEGRVRLLLAQEDHVAAAARAADFRDLSPRSAHRAYSAARYLARCVQLAAQDTRLSPEKRKALAAAYGDRAVASLREAVRRGFADLSRLGSEQEFDPLQKREDFRQLLAELQRKKAQ
jgi:hypothetical protein